MMTTEDAHIRGTRRGRRSINEAAPLPAEPNRAAIALLDEWMEDESGYDEAIWPELRDALERDRLSTRTLFHA